MLTSEQKARQLIDAQLMAAGWVLQDRDQLNRTAALGVAVREFPTALGPADYALLQELAVRASQANALGQGCRRKQEAV